MNYIKVINISSYTGILESRSRNSERTWSCTFGTCLSFPRTVVLMVFFPQLSSLREAGADLSVSVSVLAFPLCKLPSTFNLSSGSCQGGWVSCSANCSARRASPDTKRQSSKFSVHVEDSKHSDNEKNFYWNWKTLEL